MPSRARAIKYSTRSGPYRCRLRCHHSPQQEGGAGRCRRKGSQDPQDSTTAVIISEDDRYQQTIAIWRDATNEVKASLKENFGKLNPIYMMADSGARGSMDQINQLAGMRGNIANTSGQTIEIPIRCQLP